MTVQQVHKADQARQVQCAESFLRTEQCLSRSRACLQKSYTLFAQNRRSAKTARASDSDKGLTRSVDIP